MGKNGLCFCLFALLSSVERHPSAGFRPIKLNTPLDGGAAATDDSKPSFRISRTEWLSDTAG